MKNFIAFTCLLLLLSCKKTELNDTYKFKLQECKNYSETNVRLCFNRVVSDSRCPIGMVCITSGTAIAEFTFTKGNNSSTFQLATSPLNNEPPRDTTIEGYKIEFVNLSPYPGSISNPAPSDFEAEVKVIH